MGNELVLLSFDKIMQTKAYTVVVLGAHDKRFAIYTEPGIGRLLQTYLTGKEHPRPLTHDLMNDMFKGLNVRIRQVIINDVEETIYFARLFLEQESDGILHILEIDARPSDCITLALMNHVPVYCTHKVMDKIIPIDE